MKILSVDDTRTIRKTVQSMVEVIGADFLEAENGQEGLDVLAKENGNVDLIILDIEMPVMDGLEFLKRVKSSEEYTRIPIIMLTTVNLKERMVEAIRLGAKQYMTKPFTSEQLLTKIVQALGMDDLDIF